MLTREDMAALTAAEEKRLGVNSPEFRERHNEIMGMIDQSSGKKKIPKGDEKNEREERRKIM